MEKRYIITLWIDILSHDGLDCELEIYDNNYLSPEHARDALQEKIIQLELTKDFDSKDWFIMDYNGNTNRNMYFDINKTNKVLYSKIIKRGDGTGFRSKKYFFDIIEVNKNTIVNAEMFAKKGDLGDWEVNSYFKKKYTR